MHDVILTILTSGATLVPCKIGYG